MANRGKPIRTLTAQSTFRRDSRTSATAAPASTTYFFQEITRDFVHLVDNFIRAQEPPTELDLNALNEAFRCASVVLKEPAKWTQNVAPLWRGSIRGMKVCKRSTVRLVMENHRPIDGLKNWPGAAYRFSNSIFNNLR